MLPIHITINPQICKTIIIIFDNYTTVQYCRQLTINLFAAIPPGSEDGRVPPVLRTVITNTANSRNPNIWLRFFLLFFFFFFNFSLFFPLFAVLPSPLASPRSDRPFRSPGLPSPFFFFTKFFILFYHSEVWLGRPFPPKIPSHLSLFFSSNLNRKKSEKISFGFIQSSHLHLPFPPSPCNCYLVA